MAATMKKICFALHIRQLLSKNEFIKHDGAKAIPKQIKPSGEHTFWD